MHRQSKFDHNNENPNLITAMSLVSMERMDRM